MKTTSSISIIDASAGTGKTHTLTERIYSLLKTGSVSPDSLLLTTFTKKAAQELKDRVASKLVEAGDRQSAHLIRRSQMGTVNSVCDALLRENAFQIGSAIELDVIDEMQAQIIFHKALSLSLKTELSQAMDDYSSRFNISDPMNGSDWKDSVKRIIDCAQSNNIPTTTFTKCAEASIRTLLEGIAPVQGKFEEFIAVLRSTLKIMVAAQEVKAQKNIGDAIDLLRKIEKDYNTNGKAIWADIAKVIKLNAGAKLKTDVTELQNLAAEHMHWQEFYDDISGYIQSLFVVASQALVTYSNMKKENGYIDFADQEKQWLNALDNHEVVLTLKDRAGALYVDEFQDTSPIQLAIFLKMHSAIGSSVWVGDPKQSIFAFRGADPALMRMVQASMSVKEETPLNCNWRSRPKLVEFFSSVFKKPFLENGLIFPDMDSARKDNLSPFWLESWLCNINHHASSPKSSIANGILDVLSKCEEYPVLDKKSKVSRPIQASDIAILAHSNNYCAELSRALDEAGIPNDIGTAGLLKMDEIILIRATLSLMHDNSDSLAAAQIVWFNDVQNGDSTESIESKRSLWFDTLLRMEAGEKRALFSHPSISKILESSKESILMSLPEKIRFAAEISGVYRSCGVRTGSARSVINHIEQLTILAEKFIAQQQTESKWADYFGLKLFFETLESEELDATMSGGGNAVRISTWHASKGLEWPMVIICGLTSEPFSKKVFNTRVITDGTFSPDNPLDNRLILSWPYPYGDKSVCEEFISTVEQNSTGKSFVKELESEQLRVLYVTFTRARDYLIFAGTRYFTKKDGETIKPYTKLTYLIENGHISIPKTDGNGWRVKTFEDESLTQNESCPPQWFEASTRSTVPPPLFVSPSNLDGTGNYKADKLISFASPIPVTGKPDPIALGEAFHVYMAVDTSKLSQNHKELVANRLLTNWGVASNVKGADIIKQAMAFQDFVYSKWGNAIWRRELPLQLFEAGQIIRGRTDLLLEVGENFAVFDYKAVQNNDEESLRTKAVSYAPQLDAYRRTALSAGKSSCLGMFIIYPVLGMLIEVR